MIGRILKLIGVGLLAGFGAIAATWFVAWQVNINVASWEPAGRFSLLYFMVTVMFFYSLWEQSRE